MYIKSLSDTCLLSPEDLQKCQPTLQRFSAKLFSLLLNKPSNRVNFLRDGPLEFFRKEKHPVTIADFTLPFSRFGPANQTST